MRLCSVGLTMWGGGTGRNVLWGGGHTECVKVEARGIVYGDKINPTRDVPFHTEHNQMN